MAELTDSTTTVAELKTRVLAFVRERDWEQFHSPKNLSMALAAEAGELMEHFLWASPEASKALVQDAVKRQKIASLPDGSGSTNRSRSDWSAPGRVKQPSHRPLKRH